MISYLEMAQRFPVGAEVEIPVPKDGGAAVSGSRNAVGGAAVSGSRNVCDGTASCGGAAVCENRTQRRTVVGYEYCNGTGCLLFDGDERRELGSPSQADRE